MYNCSGALLSDLNWTPSISTFVEFILSKNFEKNFLPTFLSEMYAAWLIGNMILTFNFSGR